MKIKTALLGAVLITSFAWASAQTPSASQSATSPDPQTVPSTATAPATGGDQSSAALQSRIQDALRNEPTLSSSHVTVNVTDNAIDLAGTVGSGKDKLTAERIAESFDGNRQLKDDLVVTGHGHSDMAPDHPAMNNGGTGSAPNPAMNSDTSGATTPPSK